MIDSQPKWALKDAFFSDLSTAVQRGSFGSVGWIAFSYALAATPPTIPFFSPFGRFYRSDPCGRSADNSGHSDRSGHTRCICYLALLAHPLTRLVLGRVAPDVAWGQVANFIVVTILGAICIGGAMLVATSGNPRFSALNQCNALL